MGLGTGIAVFLVAWWIVLFAVLPWGNAPEENPGEGHIASAPAKPRLRLKFLITTGLAAIIWLGIYLAVEMDIVDFYREAEIMVKEDIE